MILWVCELLKLKFRPSDGYRIILVVALIPLLIVFIPQIQTEFSILQDNSKNFLSALGVAGVGVTLLILKKYVEKKGDVLTENQGKEKNELKPWFGWDK